MATDDDKLQYDRRELVETWLNIICERVNRGEWTPFLVNQFSIADDRGLLEVGGGGGVCYYFPDDDDIEYLYPMVSQVVKQEG